MYTLPRQKPVLLMTSLYDAVLYSDDTESQAAANYSSSGTNKSTGYEYILEDSANFIDDTVRAGSSHR